MDDKKMSLEYANSLIFEMQKAFCDERGKGARFRMTTVGREFYKAEVLPLLNTAEIGKIIEIVEAVLKEKGIVSQVGL